MHHAIENNPGSEKPEIIDYYNCTKVGVDSMDQKCANYSSSWRTRRWPMTIFFTIHDISTVNVFVLFRSYRDSDDITRLDMKSVSMSLIETHMKGRLSHTLPQELKLNIRRIMKLAGETKPTDTVEEEEFEKRKTCALCPPKQKRNTKYPCYKCQRPICLQCSKKVCGMCVEND